VPKRAMRNRRRQPKQAEAAPVAAVETQAPWVGRHNYVLNSATVLRDAYRLLCLIMADDGIARLSESENDLLGAVRDQFVEDELVHLLISTAVMNRAQDDHMSAPRNDEGELGFAPLHHECGSLVEDITKDEPKEIALSFREACNKIIHADHITAEVEQIEGAAYPVLPRALVLRGRQGKKAWQAFLNVPEYVRGTFRNFRDLR
jgi:hypothetical protein